MDRGRFGGAPVGYSVLLLLAVFVGAWVAVAADRESRDLPEPVDFATTEDLQDAFDYALSLLPPRGSPVETPEDREYREVIEAAAEGQIVAAPTTVPPPPSSTSTPPRSTTTTSTTTTSTTTTVPRPPPRVPSIEEILDAMNDQTGMSIP